MALCLLNVVGLILWAGHFSLLVQTIENLLLSLSIDVHQLYLVVLSVNILHAAIGLVTITTCLTLLASIMLSYLPLHNTAHLAISSILWLIWLCVDVFLFVVCGGFSVWLAVTLSANFAIWTVRMFVSDLISQAIGVLQFLNVTGDLEVAEIEEQIKLKTDAASATITIAMNASVGSIVGLALLCIGCICIICSLSWDISLMWQIFSKKAESPDPKKIQIEMANQAELCPPSLSSIITVANEETALLAPDKSDLMNSKSE